MDTGVMLMKNTPWTRSFWAQATHTFRDPERMDKVRCNAVDGLLSRPLQPCTLKVLSIRSPTESPP